MQPNGAEKAQGAAWALAKMNSKGPVGKLGVRILKFTGGAKLSGWGFETATIAGHRNADIGYVGMTGAEIAAAAAAIVGAIASIMKSLNRPGEAPADPRQGEAEEEGEEDSAGAEGALKKAYRRRKPFVWAPPPPPPPGFDGVRREGKKGYRR